MSLVQDCLDKPRRRGITDMLHTDRALFIAFHELAQLQVQVVTRSSGEDGHDRVETASQTAESDSRSTSSKLLHSILLTLVHGMSPVPF